jgi:hypothetical protein
LAYRAEQQPDEFAPAPCPHHEEFGILGCFDQGKSRSALDHDPLDLNCRGLIDDTVDDLVKLLLGLLECTGPPQRDVVTGLIDPCEVKRIRVYRLDSGACNVRVAERPAKGSPSSGGIIDSNHDAFHTFSQGSVRDTR